MGFNPYRPHRTSRTDHALVAVALLLTALLVLWAVGAL
jgi:hypothetical protein